MIAEKDTRLRQGWRKLEDLKEANGNEMAERGLDFNNGLYSTICKFISGDTGEWGILRCGSGVTLPATPVHI